MEFGQTCVCLAVVGMVEGRRRGRDWSGGGLQGRTGICAVASRLRALWGDAVGRSWTSVAEGDACTKAGQTIEGGLPRQAKSPKGSGNCS